MPRKTRSASTLNQRLIAMAEAAQADDDPESTALPESHQRLAETVEQILDRGSDKPIRSAVEALDAKHAHEAAELLSFWADDAAQTLDITITRTDGPVEGTANLFLVPLVIATTTSDPLPLDVNGRPQFDAFVKSLRVHHLIGTELSALMLGRLYRLADLPSGWVMRRHWLQQIVVGAAGQPASTPKATPEPSREAPELSLALHLRFFVGVILAEGEESSVLWDQLDLPSLPESVVEERLEAWRADAGPLVQKMLESPNVMLGDPGLWSEAVEEGIELWNEVIGGVMLNKHCEVANAAPDRVLADIRWMEQDAVWQIALSSPTITSEPWRWLIAKDPAESREALVAFLRMQGIRRFAWDEHGLPE